MDREREARAAVESMISGNMLASQTVAGGQAIRSSSVEGLSSIDLNHSINSNRGDYSNEDVMCGFRQNGRMSVVRRFFCLFVTFDLLFTVLMWLICIMMIGDDIVAALVKQVVHFSIHTSLFDIVMAACARFLVLILFYGLLYINHWFIIAISTSGTCAFLIAKVFVYHWADANQPAFQVLLILTSFVLSWGETWFLDFRVLPQESHARQFFIVSRADTSVPGERDPLMGGVPGSYYGGMPDHSNKFYSPMGSSDGSGDEGDGDFEKIPNRSKLTPQEEEYKKKGFEVLRVAWRLINSDGWKVEKKGSGDVSEGGDVCDEVYSMVLPSPQKGKKIFRLKGRVDLPPQFLLNELFFQLENAPSWNPTLVECNRIQVVDDHTDIIHVVTAEAGAGLVSSRDFVNLRHWDIVDGSYISAGVSVTHPDIPPLGKYVRGENGPGCWAMTPVPGHPGSCVFQWLLDTNLKGWLNSYVVDGALTGVMFDYIRSLRQYAQKLNSSKGPLNFVMPLNSQEEDITAKNS